MRVFSLAAVALVFAFAACSDVASPIATGLGAMSPTAVGGAAHFVGGKKIDARGKHGRDHDDQQECGDDDDSNNNDHHWGKRGHHHSRWHSHWGKRGHHDYRRGKRGHKQHHRGKGGDDDDQATEDCGGGDGGGATTATISGTVINDNLGANGFPVFLLDAGGTAVVANTTTDGTGAYSFAEVQPGTYLVCEADPFVGVYGFLGESSPENGASCPSGYAPVGYSLTVTGGATAGGNDFANFGLL